MELEKLIITNSPKPDFLTLKIKYNGEKNKFEIYGNVNKFGQESIVDEFLIRQIGAGKDNSKPNIQDTYNIQLNWFPHLDRIHAFSDTGNFGLRDGILLHFLRYLEQ